MVLNNQMIIDSFDVGMKTKKQPKRSKPIIQPFISELLNIKLFHATKRFE